MSGHGAHAQCGQVWACNMKGERRRSTRPTTPVWTRVRGAVGEGELRNLYQSKSIQRAFIKANTFVTFLDCLKSQAREDKGKVASAHM